ncbi:hypothetical protein A3H80_01175 [Candidatus Roizmanbacteria bacterium RIFCSPLOWO2_02_FULL_37_19]|uniref:Ketopantoate reductase N-terminal domain-containing protein n=1 Tax=Candidatus Roizmanbacteria bacterium RIFCSPHIGHO2_02_FULL_37_24 TaxID=1802037 RepID=A0A1F7GTX9_9BACT|nr:MAG: hypothetical protein A2862_00620 [Candidatus Roizmanbacteria bacterium RIFCSPHIGHO2_01_FULL_38_41]OGK22549.1 MAG: hypothetical protein A3C24_05295 [Candidatus Roizmanbacteria bacterium RIFCSPHIGHO2_02_FULL_37_24]OGK33949.1 MAG: hypothetical protein A3E10_02080 [Candidatus Roizmanbacteria bacterium RIFCSPHIGHO2_12_FULL_37_23]OGK43633.1 MAG: hypothetical protein A2956_03985 [Candidatus Roizmanbacteria bacterium RIFCSPLOWO2_01_FULL_37_57]OGK54212.1 MAG: hypothetical protein A3H80_01175 [Ca
MSERERPTEVLQPHSSVAIISMGQTGSYFAHEILLHSGVPVHGVVRALPEQRPRHIDESVMLSDSLTDVLGNDQPPELIIVATPIHKTQEVLTSLADANYNEPVTVLLTQNGVGIGDKAIDTLQGHDNFRIVRGSLFASVSFDPAGRLRYDRDHRRIAFAPVVISEQDPDEVYEETLRVQRFFDALGHETHVVEDDIAMEWTKLLGNSFGRSMVIYGGIPSEVLNDPTLYQLEVESFLARANAMHKAGIPIVRFPWLNLRSMERKLRLTRIATIDRRSPFGRWVRNKAAETYIRGRGDVPPAAARKLDDEGILDPEIPEYAGPFVELAQRHGCPVPVLDFEMLKFYYQHEGTGPIQPQYGLMLEDVLPEDPYPDSAE